MTPELERLLGAMAAGQADEARVVSLYEAYLRSCGLDHFTLGVIAAHPETGEDHLEIWTSMSDAWMEEYNGLGYGAHDYVLKRVQDTPETQSLTAFDWGVAVADAPETSRQTRQVLRGAADAGLANAVTFAALPRAAGDVRYFAATFGAPNLPREEVVRRIEARRNELLIAAFAMMPILRPALARRMSRHEAKLTPRETDVLGRFAQGLRPEQIAHDLGLAKRTVDMHAANARRKLKARTMAEAAAKAIRFGLI